MVLTCSVFCARPQSESCPHSGTPQRSLASHCDIQYVQAVRVIEHYLRQSPSHHEGKRPLTSLLPGSQLDEPSVHLLSLKSGVSLSPLGSDPPDRHPCASSPSCSCLLFVLKRSGAFFIEGIRFCQFSCT